VWNEIYKQSSYACNINRYPVPALSTVHIKGNQPEDKFKENFVVRPIETERNP
jgi:hypothetical protein